MEEKKNKRSRVIKVVALLGIFLITFGVSYALFSVVLNGTKKNRIKTATFGLTLTDKDGHEETEGYGINLEEAVPIEDEKGLAQEPYTFVVTNTGTIPASYTLTLESDGVNTLEDQYIKYRLRQKDYLKTKTGEYYYGGLYDNDVRVVYKDQEESELGPPLLSELENRTLSKTTLLPGEKIEYSLNLWVDYDAGNEAMNKEFNARVKIDGVQATTYMEGKAGDNVNYTLYNDGTLAITGEGPMNNVECLDDNCSTANTFNNLEPFMDIIYQQFKKEGYNNVGEVTVDLINGGDLEEGKIYPQFMGQLIIYPDYADRYKLSNEHFKKCIQENLRDYNYCSDVNSIVQNFNNDYDEIMKALAIVKKIPTINRVVIDEGITSYGPMLTLNGEMGNYMLTLPSTFTVWSYFHYDGYSLIIPPKITALHEMSMDGNIIELTIPGTVKTVEALALEYVTHIKRLYIENGVENIKGNMSGRWLPSLVIYVDNTEEYVKENWPSYWNSNSKVVYLR